MLAALLVLLLAAPASARDVEGYLSGGTAKLVGDKSTLRCRFLRTPSVRVRCFNGDGHSIEVTRTTLRRVVR